MSLAGRVVLITGAGHRIGAYLARRCSENGAEVVLHTSGTNGKAEEMVRQYRNSGRNAWALAADFSQPENVIGLVEKAYELAHVDCLINNAAIFEPLGWEAASLEAWQRHLNINLTAPFLLSQEFARLRQSQTGTILNILDWRALRPGADHLPYTISKAGLAALTRSLAAALAPTIRVNGLALGAILPPSDGGQTSPIPEKVPAGRWADLDEVFHAAEFLINGPDYITGQILHLDGGRHLV